MSKILKYYIKITHNRYIYVTYVLYFLLVILSAFLIKEASVVIFAIVGAYFIFETFALGFIISKNNMYTPYSRRKLYSIEIIYILIRLSIIVTPMIIIYLMKTVQLHSLGNNLITIYFGILTYILNLILIIHIGNVGVSGFRMIKKVEIMLFSIVNIGTSIFVINIIKDSGELSDLVNASIVSICLFFITILFNIYIYQYKDLKYTIPVK